jgi:hypothetical protein
MSPADGAASFGQATLGEVTGLTEGVRSAGMAGNNDD